MPSSPRNKFIAGFIAVWLVLMMAALGMQLVERERLAGSVATATQAARLDDSLAGLFSAIQDAETGQRGFLLTGNNSYLAPFERADAAVPGLFNDLAPMVADNRDMQNDLLELRGLVEVKLMEMRQTIAVRRQKNLAAALELVQSDQGKETMDHIRGVVARMRERLMPALAQTAQAEQNGLARGRWLDLATGLLGVGAGVIGIYLLVIVCLQDKSSREMSEEKSHVEEAMVEKSAFLANISHEIRTPMNAILGFGELLEEEELTHRQAQFVRNIRQSGRALLQLLNEVLDLSKLEAGQLELRLEPTDFREICSFLQMMFAQQAAAKAVQLKWETGEVPNALLLDRLRLRQVLINLVGNAVKFTERGHVRVRAGWVRDAWDHGRGTLSIRVEDTGPGISPEKQEEIFKPFVQSRGPQAVECEGTGLGLFLVQRLTGAMGGTVTLESAPGHGSAFCVRFPGVAVSARLPVNDEEEKRAPVNFNELAPATLLIVDDSEANRSLVASIFEDTHHQIRHAGNGKEALSSIAEQAPALILLDVRMPGMDGRQTLAEIRKTPSLELLPVIAMSASDSQEEEPDLRHRFNGYIRKPFTQRTLYRELALFLPKHSDGGFFPASTAEQDVAAGLAQGPPLAGGWDALVVDLRAIQLVEWAGLRESLAINEAQAFAQKLLGLAQVAQCAPLAAYARALTRRAQTYSIHDLESLIADFPAMVGSLEQNDVHASS